MRSVLTGVAIMFCALSSVAGSAAPLVPQDGAPGLNSRVRVDMSAVERYHQRLEAAAKKGKSDYAEYKERFQAMIAEQVSADWKRLTADGTISKCPGLDAMVQTLVDSAWRMGSDVARQDALRDELGKAVSECNDPIFRHFAGIALRPGREVTGAWRDVMRPSFDFANSDAGAKLSPLVRIRLLADGAYALGRADGVDRPNEMRESLREAILAFVAAEGGRREGDRTVGSDAWWRSRLVARVIIDAFQANPTISGFMLERDVVDQVAAMPAVDPWLVALLQAQLNTDLGGYARGTDIARNTTDSQFMKASEYMQKAVEAVDRAAKEDPTRPEPFAIGLATRAVGGGRRFEEFYWSAVDACPNWAPAHMRYLNFLRPRWGGHDLAEYTLALMRFSSGGNSNSVCAMEGVSIMVADGVSLEQLLQVPELGPAIKKTAAECLDYARRDGAADLVARAAAIQVAVLAAQDDWDGLAKIYDAGVPVWRDAVANLGQDARRVAFETTVRRKVGSADALRDRALSLERDAKYGEAAQAWTSAAGASDLADPAVKAAFEMRADGCALRASLAAGEPTSLGREGLWAIAEDFGAWGTLDGTVVELTRNPSARSQTQLGLDLPLKGAHYVLTGVLDWSKMDMSKQTPRMMRLGIGFHAQALLDRGPGCSIVLMPDERALYIWAGEREPEAYRVEFYKGTDMAFRVEVQGDYVSLKLADNKRVWRGKIDPEDPFLERTGKLGLVVSHDGPGVLRFRDLVLQLNPKPEKEEDKPFPPIVPGGAPKTE